LDLEALFCLDHIERPVKVALKELFVPYEGVTAQRLEESVHTLPWEQPHTASLRRRIAQDSVRLIQAFIYAPQTLLVDDPQKITDVLFVVCIDQPCPPLCARLMEDPYANITTLHELVQAVCQPFLVWGRLFSIESQNLRRLERCPFPFLCLLYSECAVFEYGGIGLGWVACYILIVVRSPVFADTGTEQMLALGECLELAAVMRQTWDGGTSRYSLYLLEYLRHG
jgi:hypothetical protein